MKEFTQDDVGIHNGQWNDTLKRVIKGKTYKNLSTVWITPTRGSLSPRVVSSWLGIIKPMNQPFVGPIFIEGDEVGEAYEKAFKMVLEHPELSKFKYIFTVEEDNLPPQDALLRLYENMEKGYDCVAGLYWTKGESGQPMIYGDPKTMPKNYLPQIPCPDALQHCNGLGMGCNLWSIESLKKKLKKMPRPWFKTTRNMTQDLFFFNEASKHGYKVACDTSCKVGHFDVTSGIVW